VSAIVGRAPDVMVPSHRDVVRSVHEGMPIVQGRPRTDVAQSFRSLADLYLGTEVRPPRRLRRRRRA
jgi:MinD-like ATPase involved in chromosome partitioning or flagellar assembly